MMQFLAQFNPDEPVVTITMEQAGTNVFIRVDGVVLVHFVGGTNEVSVVKLTATQKGLNLIVEE
jgi:hypothetical protein